MRVVLACAAALLVAAAAGRPAAGGEAAPEARRLVALLRSIEAEYREALDAGGRIARPIEILWRRSSVSEMRW